VHIHANCHEFSTINPVLARFPNDTVFQIWVLEASAPSDCKDGMDDRGQAERYRKNEYASSWVCSAFFMHSKHCIQHPGIQVPSKHPSIQASKPFFSLFLFGGAITPAY
jgi:hypothetical protein